MKIVIVDDDQLVCTSLKIILQVENQVQVLATGSNAAEAVMLYKKYQPDVLLMDIRMGQVTGIDAAKDILKQFPEAKILFLTTFSDEEYIVQALKIGAKGYLLKQDYESILPALKAVLQGQSVFGHEIITKLPNMLHKKQSFDYTQYDLTEKEYQIICLIAEGKSNKEIAEEMFLGEGTVRNYLSNILLKLGVRDRTQVAVFYYKHNE